MAKGKSKTKELDLDPRQALFVSLYLDPKSETFSNALQSAIKAGYSEEYAAHIITFIPDWLAEKVHDSRIINQAERNLESFLSPEEEDKKIKADMTKFALERLNKKKYASRSELTGKDGESIIPLLGGDSNAIREDDSDRKAIETS